MRQATRFFLAVLAGAVACIMVGEWVQAQSGDYVLRKQPQLIGSLELARCTYRDAGVATVSGNASKAMWAVEGACCWDPTYPVPGTSALGCTLCVTSGGWKPICSGSADAGDPEEWIVSNSSLHPKRDGGAFQVMVGGSKATSTTAQFNVIREAAGDATDFFKCGNVSASGTAGKGCDYEFWMHDLSGNEVEQARISSLMTVNTATITDSSMLFWTRGDPGDPGTSSLAEWMRITGIGYVGINTTTPRNRLDVAGAIVTGAYAGDVSATAPPGGIRSEGTIAVGFIAAPSATILEGVGAEPGVFIRQTSTTGYTGYRAGNNANDLGRAVALNYAGSAYATALLTNGVDGETAALTTTGNYPLGIGTNGTMRIWVQNATGGVGVNTAVIPRGGYGMAQLAIHGTNASAASGPHTQWTTSSDAYPLAAVYPWAHDNVSIGFDAFNDGTNWRMGDASGSTLANTVKSAYLFSKIADRFILGGSGGTPAVDATFIPTEILIIKPLATFGSTLFQTGIGLAYADPTAQLHLPASATVAGSGSLKINAGEASILATPESGVIENTGSCLLYTKANLTRACLLTAESGSGVTGNGTGTRAAFWSPVGATNVLTSDADFYWDNVNKRLGVGTTVPTAPLQVKSSSAGGQIYATDSTAFAAGTGGGVAMGGYYTGTTETVFAFMQGFKENATDGNFAGAFRIYTIPSAGVFTERWRVTSAGHLIAGVADSTYDIGDSGATARPRTLYLGTSAVVGGATTLSANSMTSAASLLIDAGGTLNLNTTNNFAVTTGTGTTTLAGTFELTAAAYITDKGLLYGQSTGVVAQTAQGSTYQVLHSAGGAAAPFFAAVDLAVDVTGNLPVGNLNSGTLASATTCWYGDGTWKTCGSGLGAVTGTGANLQVTLWNGTSTVTGNSGLVVNSTTATTRLGIGMTPAQPLDITSGSYTMSIGTTATGSFFTANSTAISSASTTSGAYFNIYGGYESWLNWNNTSNTSGRRIARFGSGHALDTWQMDLLNDAGSAVVTSGIWKVDLGAPAGSFQIDSAGKVGIGGAPSRQFSVINNQNAGTFSSVHNTTAGPAAEAAFIAYNDLTKHLQTGIYSSTTTALGAVLSGQAFVYTDNASGGLVLMANDAAGTIRLATGGSTLRATLGTTGLWTWAAYTTTNGVFYGSTSGGVVSQVAAATVTGQFFRGVASGAPIWSTLTLPNAGTTGDIFIASGTNTMSTLADVAVGSYLRSGGVTTAPLWSTLTLPNAATTGALFTATATNVMGTLAMGTPLQILQVNAGGTALEFATPAVGAVSSVTGTTNQITASPTTGAVVLSTPATFIAPGTIESTGILTADSDIKFSVAGKHLFSKESGAGDDCSGVAVLVAGTATITTSCVPATTANSRILVTSQIDGGTPGWVRVSAKVASTSFDITSSSVLDTSTVGWLILEKN